ncbi:MAG: putative molybdenum carrier protein [Rhodospirillales bacterium]
MSAPSAARLSVVKIVSGGQTGVDRAALDAAIALGITLGGWVPRNRRAEDGRVPDRYAVRETASDAYDVRTRFNVRDSDATLILTRGRPTGGTALTVAIARALGRPLHVLDLDGASDLHDVRAWLAHEEIRILNVAGPRESSHPGIHDEAFALLMTVLADG